MGFRLPVSLGGIGLVVMILVTRALALGPLLPLVYSTVSASNGDVNPYAVVIPGPAFKVELS